MKIEGTLKFIDINFGAWVIELDSGQKYEIDIESIPEEHLNDGKKIVLEVEVREDLFSNNMLGPIIEIKKVL